MHTSMHRLLNMGGNGGNVITNCNTFHHSNHLRRLLCYKGQIGDNKTVEIVSVAICVRCEIVA